MSALVSMDNEHLVPTASDVEAVERVIWHMILHFAGLAKEANWTPVLLSHGLSLRKQHVFWDGPTEVS